jgi:hypothetical protein
MKKTRILVLGLLMLAMSACASRQPVVVADAVTKRPIPTASVTAALPSYNSDRISVSRDGVALVRQDKHYTGLIVRAPGYRGGWVQLPAPFPMVISLQPLPQ